MKVLYSVVLLVCLRLLQNFNVWKARICTKSNTTVRRVSTIQTITSTTRLCVAKFCLAVHPLALVKLQHKMSRSSEMARLDMPQAYIISYCLSVVTKTPPCTVSEILPVLAVSGWCCCCCKMRLSAIKRLKKPITLDVNSPWPLACHWQGRFPAWGRCV